MGPNFRSIHPFTPHSIEFQANTDAEVIGSLAGIIGSLQTTEVIKIIPGLEDGLSGKLFIFDFINLKK